MKAWFRVTTAVVQTGSRLVRFACGTTRSVRAAAPPCASAGAGSAPARAAAPAARIRLRRSICPVPCLGAPDAPEDGEALHPVDEVPPERGHGVVGAGRDVGQPLHRRELDLTRHLPL